MAIRKVTYGHQKGDDVLVMISSVLSKSTRKGDIVGRYGGEEFVIYLPMANLAVANEVASRIHEELKSNDVHPTTLSIGVTLGTANEPFHLLIARADSAVYTAKTNGKNQTQFCIESKPNITFSTDNIDRSKYMPHGRVELTVIEGNIALYTATGPFNEELMQAIAEIEGKALSTLQKGKEDWGELVVFQDNCIALPSFINDLQCYMRELNDLGEAPFISAFVIPNHIKGAGEMNVHYEACYSYAGIEFSIFESEIEAIRWIKGKVTPTDH
jgi:hypothetical protein